MYCHTTAHLQVQKKLISLDPSKQADFHCGQNAIPVGVENLLLSTVHPVAHLAWVVWILGSETFSLFISHHDLCLSLPIPLDNLRLCMQSHALAV